MAICGCASDTYMWPNCLSLSECWMRKLSHFDSCITCNEAPAMLVYSCKRMPARLRLYGHTAGCLILVRPSYLLPAQPCAKLQGFASGSLDDDAFAPRFFVDQGLEVMVSQSYSKNLGELHDIFCKGTSCHTVSICSSMYANCVLDRSILHGAFQPSWLSVACLEILLLQCLVCVFHNFTSKNVFENPKTYLRQLRGVF